jgi:hypothetical protein
MRNAVQSSGRRWRDTGIDSRSQRPLGRVLVMPMHSDLSSPSSRQNGHARSADAFEDDSGWRSAISCWTGKTQELTEGGNMKAPGVRAKKGGTKMERGVAMQLMVYPRQKTKGVLVETSRDVSRSVSSFLILAALKEAAALRGCAVQDLIPADELEQYQKSRVGRRRSKAAKR